MMLRFPHRKVKNAMNDDPNEALASIREARGAVPGDMKYPFTYDLAYGAVCGLLVAGQGLPQPWSFLVLVVSLVGLALMVQFWRRRFGWWVNGYSPRRARRVAIGLAVILIALMAVSIWGRVTGLWWIALTTGPAGFVAAILGGRVWMQVWKAELQEAQG